MQYAEYVTEHLRITVLRLLAGQAGYRANSSLLADAANGLGVPCTRDKVKTELAWLAEQGLIRTEAPDERLVIAALTERGLEVAEGRVRVPGVKPPSP